MNMPNQTLLRVDNCVGADLDGWLALGGGEGLTRALDDPAAVITEIADADLRGMGGAGFPTHRKWAPVAAAPDGDKYIICNGNEDEPGTFKDRFLLEHTPHQVIEGALIAAVATRANHVVLYVNPHQPEALAVTREAVQQWRAHRLFAAIEQRLGGLLSLGVVPSSGLYIGGEETAVIASVEGGFPFPRRKPPFPAEQGVHGAPTVVNNTETLAHVPGILRHGAQWYRNLGEGNAAGTKLYSLSGDVLRPGLYELPMGTRLETLIFEYGGGMLQDKEFKAVFTGGPSNTLLTRRDLDVALDFDSVRQRQSRLGTGAMIVVSEGTSIVRKVAEYVSFFAQGSCGQCPPCKGGTFQLMRILNRLDTGRGVRADLDALENLCRILPGSGRCGLIDGAVTVVESSINQFREEYEALLA
ncbi:complex I 51 kDa subunit family protein [Paraburkholderia terrae]|uniref:complex I 51 kDa subunit family protein n=1 Tax=Paraburkholderia terrae TaxID=311230 RepID=UPI00296B1D70|nr:NADH-ubiquinone oxidoreductase-F iron-sulfur binding region domain-containing protein [Paraburkholderia terrae]MDW3656192.1 NADH-ubiquinone oxidoreductase-F iron-sulfur binding region domain-containing protein [Paraburkholderia terrae]